MHTNNEKPGAYTGFFKKKNNGLQTAVRGGSEGTLIPQWGARRKGEQPKKTPHRDKKSPLHRNKSSKKAPA